MVYFLFFSFFLNIIFGCWTLWIIFETKNVIGFRQPQCTQSCGSSIAKQVAQNGQAPCASFNQWKARKPNLEGYKKTLTICCVTDWPYEVTAWSQHTTHRQNGRYTETPRGACSAHTALTSRKITTHTVEMQTDQKVTVSTSSTWHYTHINMRMSVLVERTSHL